MNVDAQGRLILLSTPPDNYPFGKQTLLSKLFEKWPYRLVVECESSRELTFCKNWKEARIKVKAHIREGKNCYVCKVAGKHHIIYPAIRLYSPPGA